MTFRLFENTTLIQLKCVQQGFEILGLKDAPILGFQLGPEIRDTRILSLDLAEMRILHRFSVEIHVSRTFRGFYTDFARTFFLVFTNLMTHAF